MSLIACLGLSESFHLFKISETCENPVWLRALYIQPRKDYVTCNFTKKDANSLSLSNSPLFYNAIFWLTNTTLHFQCILLAKVKRGAVLRFYTKLWADFAKSFHLDT